MMASGVAAGTLKNVAREGIQAYITVLVVLRHEAARLQGVALLLRHAIHLNVVGEKERVG